MFIGSEANLILKFEFCFTKRYFSLVFKCFLIIIHRSIVFSMLILQFAPMVALPSYPADMRLLVWKIDITKCFTRFQPIKNTRWPYVCHNDRTRNHVQPRAFLLFRSSSRGRVQHKRYQTTAYNNNNNNNGLYKHKHTMATLNRFYSVANRGYCLVNVKVQRVLRYFRDHATCQVKKPLSTAAWNYEVHEMVVYRKHRLLRLFIYGVYTFCKIVIIARFGQSLDGQDIRPPSPVCRECRPKARFSNFNGNKEKCLSRYSDLFLKTDHQSILKSLNINEFFHWHIFLR